ncbi:MAG: imidazole glycerol phosphate synthase subunit HisH [Pelagibacteraceae bacterium]|nr:imidazole glycerol phosphate synthase subunit HisH [Pelagibacteraceae bacterium]|tara:strand:- start:36042 stop:36674 length:633 start_codon:yes stop_codon:yes gene_type:complete
MDKKITIVDYGLGNILSAKQSFLRIINENNIHGSVHVTNSPESIVNATHVVLPGQGAFKSCIDGLKKIDGMVDELHNFALNKKKPFLGICVGMQLLANESEENGLHKGLGWIRGKIKKLPSKNKKLPHMGWNTVKIKKNNNSEIKIPEEDFYFVHSYYFKCKHEKNVLAETDYGINFSSIVYKENIYGVQFHPEKSSNQGLKFIKDFISL